MAPVALMRSSLLIVAFVVCTVPRMALAAVTNLACVTEDGCSFAACLGSAPGTTYYACDCVPATHSGYSPDAQCTVGNDSNNGTSPTTPWRTWNKIQAKFNSLNAGDRLAVCKGGVFSASGAGSSFVNSRCSAATPCDVTNYTPPWATGDEIRPVIDVPTSQYFANMNEGSDVIEHGYRFAGLIVSGPGSATVIGSTDAFFAYNQVYDGLICDVRVQWFSIAWDNSGGNVGTDENKTWIIRNSAIIDNGGQGFLGSNDGTIFANNKLVNNGFDRSVFNHNIYAVDGVGVTIIGNELYRSAIVAGKCDGASMVVHGLGNDTWDVAQNYVHEDLGATTGNCYGIGIDPGYSTAETNANFVVRQNTIQNNSGNGIDLSACHGCVIKDNVIIAPNGLDFGIVASDDGVVSAQGDWSNQDISILNNTIYMGGGIGIGMVGSIARGIVANNTVYQFGATGTAYCYDFDRPSSNYTFIDYNHCYRSTGGTLIWEQSSGASFSTWKIASGFDGHSLNATDPLFANVSTFDFTLQSGSPLRNAGQNTYAASTDFVGASTSESTRDIGAFEYQVVFVGSPGQGLFRAFGGL